MMMMMMMTVVPLDVRRANIVLDHQGLATTSLEIAVPSKDDANFGLDANLI